MNPAIVSLGLYMRSGGPSKTIAQFGEVLGSPIYAFEKRGARKAVNEFLETFDRSRLSGSHCFDPIAIRSLQRKLRPRKLHST